VVGDTVALNTPVFGVNGETIFAVDAQVKVTNIDKTVDKINGIFFKHVSFNNVIVRQVANDYNDVKKELKSIAKTKNWKEYFDLKNFFTDIRHTYACTVHKSQGSTYKTVFIDVSDISKNNKLQEVARLMYVAVTRASDRVVLCMDTSTIESEVKMLDVLKII
jgi:superfamily I DNA/RNA helicase